MELTDHYRRPQLPCHHLRIIDNKESDWLLPPMRRRSPTAAQKRCFSLDAADNAKSNSTQAAGCHYAKSDSGCCRHGGAKLWQLLTKQSHNPCCALQCEGWLRLLPTLCVSFWLLPALCTLTLAATTLKSLTVAAAHNAKDDSGYCPECESWLSLLPTLRRFTLIAGHNGDWLWILPVPHRMHAEADSGFWLPCGGLLNFLHCQSKSRMTSILDQKPKAILIPNKQSHKY